MQLCLCASRSDSNGHSRCPGRHSGRYSHRGSPTSASADSKLPKQSSQLRPLLQKSSSSGLFSPERKGSLAYKNGTSLLVPAGTGQITLVSELLISVSFRVPKAVYCG